MKKLMSIILSVAMMMSLTVPVFAAEIEGQGLVSIEEYEAAIQAEGAKYGIEVCVLDYDPNIPITRATVEEAVQYVRNLAKDIDAANGENSEFIEVYPESVDASPRSLMPVSVNLRYNFTIAKAPAGSADMRLETDVTYDAQNKTVLSVDSADVYQYGAFINFRSWELTDISWSRNDPSDGYVTYNIKGRISFGNSGPGGTTIGATFPVDRDIKVYCIR